jgi:hypothetical protein
MEPFVRRLVQRLLDPAQPLSRNRHFHTFQSQEGRTALKTTRRLLSLRRDLEACRAEGSTAIATLAPPETSPSKSKPGDNSAPEEAPQWRVDLHLNRLRGVRSTWLAQDELDLLRALPGVAELLPLAQTSLATDALVATGTRL